MKLVKVAIGAIALTVAIITGMIVNNVASTSEDISEPYAATYSYCAAWMSTKNGMLCSFYNTGRETRVDTRVTGLFYNTTSYRVVR
jgi:hypothetical protein